MQWLRSTSVTEKPVLLSREVRSPSDCNAEADWEAWPEVFCAGSEDCVSDQAPSIVEMCDKPVTVWEIIVCVWLFSGNESNK